MLWVAMALVRALVAKASSPPTTVKKPRKLVNPASLCNKFFHMYIQINITHKSLP